MKPPENQLQLLETILEDVAEVINNTLHKEDREGPEVREKTQYSQNNR